MTSKTLFVDDSCDA